MYPAGTSNIRTSRVVLRAGNTIRVVEAGPPAGDPVLLVHGWGACAYTFRYTLQALAHGGRRALSFDLRGHGLSDKPLGRGSYTTAALLDDVLSLMETLELSSADFVGHSLGGSIVMHFALAHPARVRRIVLTGPVGLSWIPLHRIARLWAPRFTERFARYLPPRWFTALLLRAAYGEPGRVSDEIIDEYWATSQFPEYYRAVRSLVEEFDWAPLAPAELNGIHSETLVMLGTADRLIRDADGLARSLPRATVTSIEGAGHLGIEECAAEFNAMLTRFLSTGDVSVAPSTATA